MNTPHLSTLSNTTEYRDSHRPLHAASRRQIEYGDRVFVRLRRGCRVLLEFSTDQAGDYSELLVEIQRQTRGLHGLSVLQVRNASRGWMRETPYMLGSVASPRPRQNLSQQQGAVAPRETSVPQETLRALEPPRPRKRMLMPFETH